MTQEERWKVRERQLEAAQRRLVEVADTLGKLEASTQLQELATVVDGMRAREQARLDEVRATMGRLAAFVTRLQEEHSNRFMATAHDLVDQLAEDLSGLSAAEAKMWIVGLIRRVDERRPDHDELILDAVTNSIADRLAFGKWGGRIKTAVHRES
jgi:uncharacterized protein (DUF2384 family)